MISYDNYKKMCIRGKLIRTKEGLGPGNTAYVSFYDLPGELKQVCIEKLGDPKQVVVRNLLENYIVNDPAACFFFSCYRKPDGRPLSEQDQKEKVTNSQVLNAIQTVLNEGKNKFKRGLTCQSKWTEILIAVNALDSTKYPCSLPGNWRRLKAKFDDYVKNGYEVFIHKGDGKKNAVKIKGEIADFLLANFCLPIKYSIPELIDLYEKAASKRAWPTISDKAVYNFLQQPENKRIWMLARHGKDSYNRKYKHTISRDKSEWFPNAFWVIDGTKLDWIHQWEESSSKLGAKLKVNLCFDVYSEKIIGYDLSFTESFVEHFKTIKMAVNQAKCRPYLINYDNQGGHKTERMQSLYNSLVAQNGGCHFPSKANEHSNPAEQLIGRFQKEVVTKFWFSDGQSVTVKRDDNKMNADFIKENKALIKTVDELHVAWKAAVEMWNTHKHPHFEATRNEVYQKQMPMKEDLTLWEIMDKMWIEESKRLITYKSSGLKINIGGVDHEFEVLDRNGKIDLDFRYYHVGRKFKVRYDPDFLDGYVQLYDLDANNNYVWIANAEPKIKLQNIPVLMKPGDKERVSEALQVRSLELERVQKELKALERRTGINREALIEHTDLVVKMGGNATKIERLIAESSECEYDF
jgi:hypothetical protein